MMHKLHHEPPDVVCTPKTNSATRITPSQFLAGYKIRLMIVLQSQPNFNDFLSDSRREYWNSWITAIAPKVGKPARNLIGLCIDLQSGN